MKPMIWHPEEKDAKVNQYLDQMNHAPYGLIILLLLGGFCLFTFVLLVGLF
jgi:F0F1-type ATP synthase assembly protein I